jgi:hypothetical protein
VPGVGEGNRKLLAAHGIFTTYVKIDSTVNASADASLWPG